MGDVKKNPSISDQLRQAIGAAGVTRYKLAQATGVTEAALSRFVRGERSLTLPAVDRLCAFLNLHLTKGR
jgi:transcriptional regulator with XRE-family HTH domain